MKNYEIIKSMGVEEMAAMFYLFLKPFMDSFEFDDEHRENMKHNIRCFLNAEVKK